MSVCAAGGRRRIFPFRRRLEEVSSVSEEDSDGGEGGIGLNLAGFLFGNIDMKTGYLEDDDILDEDSKRQLNALSKLGLGGLMKQVVQEGEVQPKMTVPPLKVKKSKRKMTSSEYSEFFADKASSPKMRLRNSRGRLKSKDAIRQSSSSSFPDQKSLGQEDDYEEDRKSPSAVDFSDIMELAEDDASLGGSSGRGNRDEYVDDYDAEDCSGKIQEGGGADYKMLMPSPPRVVIGGKGDVTSSQKKREEEVQPTSLLLGITGGGDDGGYKDSRLNKPLAGLLPSKYAGVDVRGIFPHFRSCNTLRFSRLFGKEKATSQPNVWKDVNERRKQRMAENPKVEFGRVGDDSDEITIIDDTATYSRSWRFTDGVPGPSDSGKLTDEDKEYYNVLNQLHFYLLKASNCDKGDGMRQKKSDGNFWRHGPAKLWYDMMKIPDDAEQLDYGFKRKSQRDSDEDDITLSSDEESASKSSPPSDTNGFPPESYLMINQVRWESDVIWDSSDIKYKKGSKNMSARRVLPRLNSTFQNFSQPGGNTSSGSYSSVAVEKDTDTNTTPTKLSKAAALNAESKNVARDRTWYSYFPVENPELVYGRWEDNVIWDVEDMKKIPEPNVYSLDPNDENIVLCIPDDVHPNSTQRSLPPVKPKVPHAKKSRILLSKAGMINVIEEDSPPPLPKADDKDPYNISNDEYYQPKFTELYTVKITASGSMIQHSTPVVELRVPFIPTHLGPHKLRNFHRPGIKRFSNGPLALPGPHEILPLTSHIQTKAKQREEERFAAGGGEFFFMRSPDDLTGKDGELLLIEYCEEYPPLLSQVGMCSKIKNYYKRKPIAGDGPPKTAYGETSFVHTSPFLGVMRPGQLISALENNMYRSPIYNHPTHETDFLVIRDRDHYYIREIDALYTAGQECPLYEVPGPNSKKANNFVRDFLQVFIYRLFWESQDIPRKVRIEDIKRAFPMISETTIRRILKRCAEFKRTGEDSNWWVINPEFRLPTEDEIRAMVSPEQCCAYFSRMAAEQRLMDAGYGEKCYLAQENDNDDNNQEKIYDEVKTAPWNTTRAYIESVKGKCLLQLMGPADPTGCGEGFSYIRVPNKPQTNKEEQEAQQPKRIVTGTDADLRRLSLNSAKGLLKKFGVPAEEIKKLSRWEIVDVVRTLSTEKAKAGVKEKGMTKFSRGNRFSVAEHQERYKEECQRIFELQNRVLSSSECLSTDEEESEDEQELSDIEEMGKNIEKMISNQKTSDQLKHDKEEQERRELQKMIFGEGINDKDCDLQDCGANKLKDDEIDEDSNSLSDLPNHPSRVLKIHRTFKNAEGKDYTRTEIVRKSSIIDVYMKIRTTKDEAFIRNFAVLDDQTKEKMKMEKRKIQDQLRRIKKNQEKAANQDTMPSTPRNKKTSIKPDIKLKCGSCGHVGHMKTNKACPLYEAQDSTPPASPINVAMTQEEEEEIGKLMFTEDEQLVKVDGTKLRISGKLIQQAEEIKRRSLVLKVPKSAVGLGGSLRKKRAFQDEPCEYLMKRTKTANRQRIDPTVAINGIFETIVNEMRKLKNSIPFDLPVTTKEAPNYHSIIKNPMDLQTMREKARNKTYLLRSEFLSDMQLIRDNCSIFNGVYAPLTVSADRLLEVCKAKVDERAEELDRLERMINPLLDDDQTGLNFILESCINKLKLMPDSFPFVKPLDKSFKGYKEYYEAIKNPMDFEAMTLKIKSNAYSGTEEFMSDLELIYANAKQFNGADSLFAVQATSMINVAKKFLGSYTEHLALLEKNIKSSKENTSGSPDQGGYHADDYEPVSPYEQERELQVDGEIVMDMETFDCESHKSLLGDESRDATSMNCKDKKLKEEEFRSDDDGCSTRASNSEQVVDNDSQLAAEALLMMRHNFIAPTQHSSSPNIFNKGFLPSCSMQEPEYLPVPGNDKRRVSVTAETPRNIHDDLAMSDLDYGDEDQPCQNPHQAPPPNDGDYDGLWF